MTEPSQPNGILIVDKPEGITSHDVVARARRALKTKRVGHTGTLDPFATGVLVLLIGKATRLAQFIVKDEKEYVAVVRFGFETDTGDRTGERTVDSGLTDNDVAERLAIVDWDDVLGKFRGEIEQVPPMYSAKKVRGKKLYELARAGKDIEREPIKIEIKQLEIIKGEQSRDSNSEIRFRVVCSAGTYIRTLAEDIGRSISIGAHLLELRRTRAGRFSLDESVALDRLDSTQYVTQFLRPIEDAIFHLPKYVLSEDRVEKTLNGLPTRVDGDMFADGAFVAMFNSNEKLVAVGKIQTAQSQLKPVIVVF